MRVLIVVPVQVPKDPSRMPVVQIEEDDQVVGVANYLQARDIAGNTATMVPVVVLRTLPDDDPAPASGIKIN